MNDKDFKEVNLEKKSKSIILPKNNVNMKWRMCKIWTWSTKISKPIAKKIMGKLECTFIFQKKCECGEDWERIYMNLHKGFKLDYKENYGEMKMHCHPLKTWTMWWKMGKIWTWLKKKSKSIAKRIMEKSKSIYLHPPKKMPMWWRMGIFFPWS